jgi:hypothetical protein
MQYRTALFGAAQGRVVTRLWLVLAIWTVFACADASPAPEPRPAGEAPSTQLTAFAFEPEDNPQLMAAVQGEIAGREVHIDLPFGSAVSALVPRVEHRGSSVAPASGEAQDFSKSVDYIVTASDGSEVTYTVTVDVLSELMQPGTPDAGAVAPTGPTGPAEPLDSTKQITQFSIAGVAAMIAGETIELTVPHDTRLLNITPDLMYKGAAILPSPLEPQDFGETVVYTVMAHDGSTREYSVHVTLAPNHSKAITHFRVFDIDSTIVGTDITLQLPAGADLTMLEPDVILSGGTVTPASGQKQDFSQPVPYTVTGEDGSTEVYTVVVSLAPGNANEIVSFEVPSLFTSLRGEQISLFAPFGASDCSGAPAIVHAGVRIEPSAGELQDFRNGVVYTVTAADGSARSYTVTCQIAETSAQGIESFEVLGLPATIVGNDITLTIPSGASLGALTPTIVHHGVRLTPASSVPQSFYAPVTYTLLDANGERRMYTVRIVNADRGDNELVDLVYKGRHAQIVGQKVELTLPAGSDLSALTPTLLHRGARVLPSATPRDFSTPQLYGVIARDGTRRDVEVSIRAASVSEKALTDFSLGSALGRIVGTEVRLRLPAGSDVRALVPSRLQHTGKGVSPSADEPQDFTSPVSYVVTAADGSTQAYEVRVSVAQESTSELVGFRLLGMDADIGPMGVQLSLPAGTNLKALVPTLEIAGSSIRPLSSLPQDFTQPVRYEITAADGGSTSIELTITTPD